MKRQLARAHARNEEKFYREEKKLRVTGEKTAPTGKGK